MKTQLQTKLTCTAFLVIMFGLIVKGMEDHSSDFMFNEAIETASMLSESLPYYEDFADVPNFSLPAGWSSAHEWYVFNLWAMPGLNWPGGEVLLLWEYQMSGDYELRVKSPMIDGTEATGVNMSFEHLVIDNAGNYTLKVQTSTDGENWTDQWEHYVASGNIPLTEVTLTLDGVAGEMFQIAFVAEHPEGVSNDLDTWAIAELYLEAALDGESYTLTFEVENPDGTPIDHAVITLDDVTNVQGDYVFENLVPGEYSYIVTADGYDDASGSITIADEDVTQIVIMEESPNYSVTFTVENLEGVSIESAVITLEDATNDPGDYVFENLLPGDYNYLVTADGYDDANGSITIVDEDVTETVVLLASIQYSVTFSVEDTAGSPIDYAIITLEEMTNDPGDYVFTDLDPGEYNYLVTANGFEPAGGLITIIDEDVAITVVLAEAAEFIITEFPFNELFGDDSETRDHWTQIQEAGDALWTFQAGSSGGAVNAAYAGTLNARFVSMPGNNTPITKLVSPVMDLSALSEPRLTFFYAQQETGWWWNPNQNETKVYYRIDAESEWIELAHYTENINTWTYAAITLPNPSATYQVAFEGINNAGHANVVDNVVVEESPPSYTVTFNVEDVEGAAINNAVITIGTITNPVGDYVFEGIEAGEYNYLVTASGFNEVAGTLYVVDDNIQVNIVMEMFLKSLPYTENFEGIPDFALPEGWASDYDWHVFDLWSMPNLNWPGGKVLLLWENHMSGQYELRVESPLIDATSATGITMTFDHLVLDYLGNYTLKVQTSTDGVNWTDQWVLFVEGGNIPLEEVNLALDGVEGEMFQIAFVAEHPEGVSNDLDTWAIAEFVIDGTFEEEFFSLTFEVEDLHGVTVDDAVITLGNITNDPGNYVFEGLEPGTYQYTITAFCYLIEEGEILVYEDMELAIILQNHPGDANGDGTINILDVIAVSNYWSTGNEPENWCFINADTNSDGIINILDIIGISNIFSGK